MRGFSHIFQNAARTTVLVFGLCVVPTDQTGTAFAQRAAVGGPNDETAGPSGTSTDILEADRLIREVFTASDTSRYADAVEAYADLLEAEGGALTADAYAARERHIAALFAVLPKDEQAAAEAAFDADRIMMWWRRQDPLPGTRRNERLEEHLARFVFARKDYENDRDERGFDDRGEVLVRLGPPVERLSLRIPEIVRAFDFRNVVSVPELPKNEVWLYPHVSDEAVYFFIRLSRREGFRLALPSEVFPGRLRVGLDQRNNRGRRRAEVVLGVLESVYAQLALAHPFFGLTHDRIAHYRALPSRERPDQFVQNTLAEATARESESEGRRERTVPAAVTNAHGISEDLPAEIRWARFLDDDGTTRTEIYWSVDPADLEASDDLVRILERDGYSPSETYLLSLSAARQTDDYITRDIQRKHFRARRGAHDRLAPQSIVLQGDTGRYHVGLQWSQYWTNEISSDSVDVGALLKIGTMRLDSLHALHGRGERLEMSDLKIVEANGERPFPFRRIDPDEPPDLYFELYNLHYGSDDITNYSIEYAVTRDGGGGELAIRVQSEHSGLDRDTKERIAIELGDVERGDRVRLSIRAADNVTGESVERSISFGL